MTRSTHSLHSYVAPAIALAPAFAIFLGAAACGGSDEPGAKVIQADPYADASGTTTVDTQGPAVDTGAAADIPGSGTPDGDGAEVPGFGGELPPGFGETCGSPDDCTSGWCYDGRCTDNCISECPTGWSCKSISGRGSDVAFLCVPDVQVTCRVCASDADCGAKDARCVPIPGDGSFCMLPCGGGEGGTICPGGTVCSPVEGGPNQCIPKSGSCICNADAAGTERACSVSTGGALCQGSQTCQGADGWSQCNASEPSPEACNGLDDDCDGVTDEAEAVGCSTFFHDGDGDGAGGTEAAACLCAAGTTFTVPVGGDCDDSDPKIKPNATELCNSTDDDCDGETDPPGSTGCTTYYEDGDADGYGVLGLTECVCVPSAPWTALIPGDCDDAAQSTHPSAPEACNAVDDDCDGDTDEGIAGAPCLIENQHGSCPGVATCVDGQGVCKGKEPAPELCNGSDDDCDGLADEGTSGALCLRENAAGSCAGKELCLGAAGLVCDADEPVAEICNSADDDCDGAIDELGSGGCVEYHADLDKDGFGADDVSECACKPVTPFTALSGGDCNDESKSTFPGAAEVCDGKDNDCDGATDEAGASGCSTFLPDGDGDGYSPVAVGTCLCAPQGTFTASLSGDCDDSNKELSPGTTEVCDGQDQNCNQIADEGCDKDGDGYCTTSLVVIGTPPICKYGGGDCDDSAETISPVGFEVCNTKDDDCDGETDEGVTAPCGGCVDTCTLDAGDGFTYPWMPGPSYFDGTSVDSAGQIVLDAQTIQLRSLWIANSGEGTVSRLDTVSGRELGRYVVCADPSRTAVAGDGSVWVGCRGDGKVAHVALDLESCIDRNNNGMIDTSRDMNADGKIGVGESLPAGQDECVLLVVQPDGATIARALAIDKKDKVWVGFWSSQNIRQLDPLTGAVLQTVNFSASGGYPYGLALDQKGRVWVALRDTGHLGMFDPGATPVVAKWWTLPGGANSYGMAVDQLGQIWQANGEAGTLTAFNPDTETFAVVNPGPFGNTRGVAASLDGYVYVAHHSWDQGCGGPATSRTVTKINAATKAVVANIDLGGLRGTVGVTIDFEGNLWAINQCASSATKIRPGDGAIIGEFPTGPSPYTYSDMTGFALKTIVAPVGTYTHVFKGWDSGATYWKVIDAATTLPAKTSLEVRYRTAGTEPGLEGALWSQWFGPFPPQALPLQIPSWAPATGRYLAVQVRLRTDDKLISPQLERLSATADDVP